MNTEQVRLTITDHDGETFEVRAQPDDAPNDWLIGPAHALVRLTDRHGDKICDDDGVGLFEILYGWIIDHLNGEVDLSDRLPVEVERHPKPLMKMIFKRGTDDDCDGDDGDPDEWFLICPNCERSEIREVNLHYEWWPVTEFDGTPDEPNLVITEDDSKGDAEGDGWTCGACGQDLELPDGVTFDFSYT